MGGGKFERLYFWLGGAKMAWACLAMDDDLVRTEDGAVVDSLCLRVVVVSVSDETLPSLVSMLTTR